jgi:hypothetical protein
VASVALTEPRSAPLSPLLFAWQAWHLASWNETTEKAQPTSILLTSLFVRNLLFQSKPSLSFKAIFLLPILSSFSIYFFVSNPFVSFQNVSNPFLVFELVSFRFKSSLSLRIVSSVSSPFFS